MPLSPTSMDLVTESIKALGMALWPLLRKDGGAIRNFALRAEFGGPAKEKGCLCWIQKSKSTVLLER